MIAPSLWVYEIANALVMAVRRGRLAAEIGDQAFNYLLAVGVRLADPEPHQVYERATQFGLTAYDAAYVALSDALGAPLWTGDRRLYRAVPGEAAERPLDRRLHLNRRSSPAVAYSAPVRAMV
jgi:predicted nucleic acid-binding protein